MEDCKINMQLLPMKGHYFLWHAGLAAVLPYMSIYAKQFGYSSFAVGIILMFITIMKTIVNPILGAAADKYKIQKIIFLMVQALGACGAFCLIFLPALPTDHRVNFTCDANGSAIKVMNAPSCAYRILSAIADETIVCKIQCRSFSGEFSDENSSIINQFDAHLQINTLAHDDGNLYLPVLSTVVDGKTSYPNCSNAKSVDEQCDAFCDTSALSEIITKPLIVGKGIFLHYQFWLILLVYFVFMSSSVSTSNFASSICLQILGDDNRYEYGFQIMFSSLGFGSFAFIAGSLIDIYSVGKVQKNYIPCFGIASGLLFLAMAVSYKIQYTQQPHKTNLLKDMTRRLRTPRASVYLIWCTFFGVYTSLVTGFKLWLLEDLAITQGCDVVGKVKIIGGISLTIKSLLGQLPLYFCSGWIFKHLGYKNAMTLGVLLSSIHFILLSCISNPWWSLPISVLTGIVDSLGSSSMVSYASVVAPRGAETTTQAMVMAIFQGGSSLGNFIGGLLVEIVGSSYMFRIMGMTLFVVCIMHGLAHYLIEKFESRRVREYNQVELEDKPIIG